MPRFKHYSYAQAKLIPIDFSRQIRPGTFEFALSYIVDGMDLSVFHHRFRNDDTGTPVYDPAVLLKKVNIQWMLSTIVHNILKIFRYGTRYAYG